MKPDFASKQVLKKFGDPLSEEAIRRDLRELDFRAAFARNYRMNRKVPGAAGLDPVLRFHLGLEGEEKKK